MKKSIKSKKILAALAISCLSLGAVVALNVNPKTASADEVLARPSSATVAAATDFYIHDGASVRVDSSGIRFVTYVTPAYHASLAAQGDVQYFATAKAVDGTEQAKEIPFRTTLNDDGNYTLYTYINFKNAETTMADRITELYAQDFTTSTFAKVTPATGDPIYYQANEGTGIVRSMRAVGNEAYLNWQQGASYSQADVEKYFTVGNRSTDITAYKLDTGKVAFQMPAYTGTATSVDAYVGAKKYTANYDANSDSFLIASCADTEENLSVFTADGTVYSTKIGEGIEINNETIGTMELAITGTYVLTEDINMANVATSTDRWGSGRPADYKESYFQGTFDGLGHKISNLTWQRDSHLGALFGGIKNATVKNVAFKGVIIRGDNMAVIAGRAEGNCTLENIYVEVTKTVSAKSSALLGPTSGDMTLKNVAVYLKECTVTPTTTTGVLTNTYLTKSLRVSGVYVINDTTVPTVPSACTLDAPLVKLDGTTAAVATVDYFELTSTTAANVDVGTLKTKILKDAFNAF